MLTFLCFLLVVADAWWAIEEFTNGDTGSGWLYTFAAVIWLALLLIRPWQP